MTTSEEQRLSQPTDEVLRDIIVQAIRDYYHEGMWEEVVGLMQTIEDNPALSQRVFADAHGFLSEVIDWYYNGEGPKDNVRIFDPSKRREKNDEEREA